MTQQGKTVVVTDSSCDLTQEQLDRYGIRLISLRVVSQNAEYRDRVDIDTETLYDMMEKELPKTSLPLPEDVSTLYEELEKQGVADVIHFCLSSGLSGTYNMVRMIAEESPMNIRVVDSLTLSTGLGMMVLEAARALENGASPEEAIKKAKAARETQLGMFVIRTLEYLRKGGRIGLVEGVVGNLLQLKPVVFVNDDGVYQSITKARGYRNAVESMVAEVVRHFGKARILLSVVHGRAQQEAQALLERLKSEMNIVESFIAPVSPVLAIHTGPGLLGIVVHRTEDTAASPGKTPQTGAQRTAQAE